jgi:hypothetical protein
MEPRVMAGSRDKDKGLREPIFDLGSSRSGRPAAQLATAESSACDTLENTLVKSRGLDAGVGA